MAQIGLTYSGNIIGNICIIYGQGSSYGICFSTTKIVEYFLYFIFSGTYNNEWMVVDYNLLKPNAETVEEQLPDGVLTVLEQLPNQVVVDDQTNVLRNNTYWSSYNRLVL